MRITSSLVSFALYLGFTAAFVIPDVRDVPRSGDEFTGILAGGKRQADSPLGPVGGDNGGGLGGIIGEGGQISGISY